MLVRLMFHSCTELCLNDILGGCKLFPNTFGITTSLYEISHTNYATFYLSLLNVEKANRSDDQANKLDLKYVTITSFTSSCMTSVRISTFTLSFLSSNIPSGPSDGVYISQLIRYARCCTYYDDFRHRYKMLVERLVSQGYRYECLRNSFIHKLLMDRLLS